MPYPTSRDFSWLLRGAGVASSPLPLQQDAKDFSLPRDVQETIIPTFDALGWARAVEASTENFTAIAANLVASTAVPANTIRYIFDVSVQQNDAAPAVGHHLWIDHRVAATSTDIGLMLPYLTIIGTNNMHVGAQRPVIMAPGDQLIGRADPTLAGGRTLGLRYRFVDLPVGESIPPR